MRGPSARFDDEITPAIVHPTAGDFATEAGAPQESPAFFAARTSSRLHCSPGRIEVKNLDSSDELKRFDPRERRDNAGGTWPAKRRLASALRALIDEMCPTGAPDE